MIGYFIAGLTLAVLRIFTARQEDTSRYWKTLIKRRKNVK